MCMCICARYVDVLWHYVWNTAHTVTFPLDITKTRLQLQQQKMKSANYKGMMGTMFGILKHEGVQGKLASIIITFAPYISCPLRYSHLRSYSRSVSGSTTSCIATSSIYYAAHQYIWKFTSTGSGTRYAPSTSSSFSSTTHLVVFVMVLIFSFSRFVFTAS